MAAGRIYLQRQEMMGIKFTALILVPTRNPNLATRYPQLATRNAIAARLHETRLPSSFCELGASLCELRPHKTARHVAALKIIRSEYFFLSYFFESRQDRKFRVSSFQFQTPTRNPASHF
jgi:hypothetical protein